MIAQFRGQQIPSYHLTLSILLLILTVYPYLFSSGHYIVAAYSADDFDLKHHLIDDFDIIQSSDIHWLKSPARREVGGSEFFADNETDNNLDAIELIHLNPPPKKLQFSSLGRKFNLILSKPAQLVTQDFTIISLDADGKPTKIPFSSEDINILDGFIDGEHKSRATASFDRQNKLMTAQIKTGEDLIIVEPTYLHKNDFWSGSTNTSDVLKSNPKLYDETMIVYKLQDHKEFNLEKAGNDTNKLFSPETMCPALNMNEYYETKDKSELASQKNEYNQDLEDIYKIYKPTNRDKYKHRSRRGIELVTEPAKDKTRCTLHLVADFLFYKNVGNGDFQTTINYILALINRVNIIYLSTVWETGDDSLEPFSNIGFTVQNITIHQDYTRISSGNLHYNMKSDRAWGAREFLDNFSKYSPPKHYCLAHLLTYRKFDEPVLGLAYVASPRFGHIGGICSPTQQKDDIFYKYNTGISTTRSINGETLITRQADLVLAHELGHNLGAEHDTKDCRPSTSSGGAYLMHPFAVMGFERNNRFLSNCSRLAIGRVLRRKASTCFIGVVDHVCGNGIVEDDEECDGGNIGHSHRDPCCDDSCRFSPGSQCSDRHSFCCSKCRLSPAGSFCRQAEEYICKQAGYCDGQSAACPPSPNTEDGKICVGRGVCRDGDCKAFCEARELDSCLCNQPADACKLCCKTRTPNSTCVPYDTKAPYLPDGVLCYRGICEKGRCEQPVQDVIERLWDVIEDINFTTFVKFLRDNIIIVVLVATIPLWCIATHYINEFDKRIKEDVLTAIMRSSRRKHAPSYQSPFLPRLFVGDDTSNRTDSIEDIHSKNENHHGILESNGANVTSV